MKYLKFILLLYCGLLVLKFSLSLFDGEITRYSLLDQTDNYFSSREWDEETPKLMTLNPTTYKLVGDKIVTKIGTSIKEKTAPECSVFDLKNWQCKEEYEHFNSEEKTWSDATLIETMSNGDYDVWSSAWSVDEYARRNKYNDVSFISYVYVSCTWQFYSNFFVGLVMCPVSPLIL